MNFNFYKETNFKETPIGKIPEDWEVVRLGDVAEFCRGYSYRSSDLSDQPTKIRFITINDFEKEGGIKTNTEPLYLNENTKIDEKFYLKERDIVIANTDMSKGFIIGAPLIVDRRLIKNKEKLVYSMDLTKLNLKDKNIFSEFLFYFLSWGRIRKIMKAYAQGTNVLHLNHDLAKTLNVILPPLQEQRKIAEILSTVDKTIEKTDEIIAKTERLKKGLMQVLLTGRVRIKVEDGEIRFYRETNFKDTEIGKVPEEWEVVGLGNKDVAEIIMGQSPPSATYNNIGKGLPFLQGKAEFGEIYPSPSVYCSKPIKIAELNDILLSVRAPVGDVNLAPFRCCIGRGLAAIRPKNDKLNNLFLFYYLKLNGKKFEIISSGSTFKAIRKDDIENYFIPLPPLPEQQKIAEILSTIDKKLELERKRKEKLERIKKGLMDVLLTGKVRVKV